MSRPADKLRDAAAAVRRSAEQNRRLAEAVEAERERQQREREGANDGPAR